MAATATKEIREIPRRNFTNSPAAIQIGNAVYESLKDASILPKRATLQHRQKAQAAVERLYECVINDPALRSAFYRMIMEARQIDDG